MQRLVFTNGGGQTIDLTSGNFGITNWEGLSGTDLNIQTQTVPFQDGGVFLDALLEQREISVTVAIQDNNDLSARYELKRQLISALNPKLGEGVLVYTNDYLSRQIKAVPQLPIFENKNSNDSGTLKASVAFTCCSPYWEDLEDTVVDVKGFNVIQNNGDVPSQIKLNIPAGSTNPIIRNQQNQKVIALDGTFQNEIIINTNIGQKTVKSGNIGFAWNSGGVFYGVAIGAGKTVYVGTQIVVEDNYTGEVEVVNYNLEKDLYAIIFANDLFVATGFQGTILTSPDGINWTSRTSGVSVRLWSLTYNNQLFVAIGEEGTILTSSDGINWTSRTSGTQNELKCVSYGNGIYIAVGVDLTILTSSNGTSWTTRTSGLQEGNLYSVIYGNGLFIIGGSSGIILTSTNGTSWTSQTTGKTTSINTITYGNNYFVAGTSAGEILASIDGENWLERESGIETELKYSIYGNSIFIFTGTNGTVITSSDSKVWNIKYKGLVDQTMSLRGIYQNGMYILVGGNGTILTSKDKKVWEKQVSGTEDNLLSICYGNGLFVVGGNYATILTSPDGINWTIRREADQNPNAIWDIAYGNGKYITVGKNLISTDGIIWESINIPTLATNGIIYGDNIFIVSGDYGGLYTSSDGINWTSRTSGVSVKLYGIVYSNGLYIVVGNNGTILTSFDGITWTSQTSGTSSLLRKITYGGGLFVAVGQEGTILTSPDGVTWTRRTTGTSCYLLSVVYSPTDNDYMATGTYGIILLSKIQTETNLISALVSQSDMSFNLEVGSNNILFTDETNKTATLSFRQKYIGV